MDQTWSYSGDYTPSAPAVKLLLQGVPIESAVDTGFSGSALVPYALFESAGLQSRLVPERYKLIMPDSREIPLVSALGDFEVGGVRFRALVHATAEVRKKLIGRAFLKSFVATLDGPKEELTLSGQRA